LPILSPWRGLRATDIMLQTVSTSVQARGGPARPGRLLALFLFMAWVAAAAGFAADASPPAPAKVAQVQADPVQDLITFSSKYTTAPMLLSGPYDGNVGEPDGPDAAQVPLRPPPLDSDTADRFLHRYLEKLDPMHIHFYKSDIDEFMRLRDRLPDRTLSRGDTSPANDIFSRFIQRVDERVEFVAGLLRENQFEFQRRGPPHSQPQGRRLGRQTPRLRAILWRQHLRYEYLNEKLNKQKPEEIIKTLSNRYKRCSEAGANWTAKKCSRSTSARSARLTTRTPITWEKPNSRTSPSA